MGTIGSRPAGRRHRGWPPAREPRARPDASRRVTLGVLLLTAFIGVLDGFVVTVALPSIRVDLGASFAHTQLVVAGYGTAFAVGLITGGRLGDLYGRRRVLLAGMAAFMAASAACGTASGPVALVVARIVQGLAAAVMTPQVLSVIRVAFPERERGRVVGWYGTTVGLGVICGPVIGGLLIAGDLAGWGWRWVFLVNLPLGAAVLAGTAIAMEESRAPAGASLDLLGVGLSASALAALLIPLTAGGEAGWPWWTVGCLGAAPVLLAAFLAHERRLGPGSATPLLPLRLFASRRFSGGIALVLLLDLAGTGATLLFIVTYYLQEGLGLTPLWSGMVLATVGLGFAAGSAAAPALLTRAGLLAPAGGIALLAAGLAGIAAAAVAAPDRPLLLVPALLAAGTGQGLAFNPLVALVPASVPAADAGVASGVLLTTVQLANAAGPAVLGSIFFALLTSGSDRPGQAAFAHALGWTVALLAVLTAAGLPVVSRLRRQPGAGER